MITNTDVSFLFFKEGMMSYIQSYSEKGFEERVALRNKLYNLLLNPAFECGDKYTLHRKKERVEELKYIFVHEDMARDDVYSLLKYEVFCQFSTYFPNCWFLEPSYYPSNDIVECIYGRSSILEEIRAESYKFPTLREFEETDLNHQYIVLGESIKNELFKILVGLRDDIAIDKVTREGLQEMVDLFRDNINGIITLKQWI